MDDDKGLELEELSPGKAAAKDDPAEAAPSKPDVPAKAAADSEMSEGMESLAQTLIDQETRSAVDLAPVYDVPVNISAVLGKAHIDVNSLLKLSSGSVLELDRKVGEAIDIYVNNRLVARGEVVVVEERLGVTMTEIIKDGDAN